MEAFLLCAGYGKRLHPLTSKIPKCLVPINGRPLLEIWITQLVKFGYKKIFINTFYLSNKVEEFVDICPFKENIELIYENELIGTAGSIKNLIPRVNCDKILIAHGDNLSFFKHKKFLKNFENRGSGIYGTMMIYHTDTPTNCGIIEKNKDGIITKYHEKIKNPPSNLANGAVYILSREFLNVILKEKEAFDFSKDIVGKYYKKFNTYYNDIYHRDIGTVESFAIAQLCDYL